MYLGARCGFRISNAFLMLKLKSRLSEYQALPSRAAFTQRSGGLGARGASRYLVLVRPGLHLVLIL